MAANTNRGLVVPTTEIQTVALDMARRRANAELRSREHLTLDEVERLIAAAKDGRHGCRDATMPKVENAVKVEPVGEFELKGIRRPLAAYNVVCLIGDEYA